jgi:O-methyltransferase involved in polyketide biosynthesis
MHSARPSRTALRVALRRAAHQLHDRPLVFEDPLAVPILGPGYLEDLRRTPDPAPGQKARPFSIGMRAYLVARSRYAEDALAQAVASGATQYVLLGAGLDTFAHRNPYPSLRVFEVDHPATQAWKRGLLAQSALPHPPSLTYAPVDFESEDAGPGTSGSEASQRDPLPGGPLSTGLLASGFDPAQPTFFAWLGVVPYLTLEAFRSTIRFIAAQPSGSGVVFDYGQPRRVLPPNEQLAHDSLAARVAQAGEPFQLFFTPSEVACELEDFRALEDLGPHDLNLRYFANRTDQLQLRGTAARILTAWL